MMFDILLGKNNQDCNSRDVCLLADLKSLRTTINAVVYGTDRIEQLIDVGDLIETCDTLLKQVVGLDTYKYSMQINAISSKTSLRHALDSMGQELIVTNINKFMDDKYGKRLRSRWPIATIF